MPLSHGYGVVIGTRHHYCRDPGLRPLRPGCLLGANGIWQDGATLARRPDGSHALICNKFKTQASVTDSTGRPA